MDKVFYFIKNTRKARLLIQYTKNPVAGLGCESWSCESSPWGSLLSTEDRLLAANNFYASRRETHGSTDRTGLSSVDGHGAIRRNNCAEFG